MGGDDGADPWDELSGIDAEQVLEEIRVARAREERIPLPDAQLLVVAQTGRCGICGDLLDEILTDGPLIDVASEDTPFEYHIDHIRPLIAGGRHSLENLQVTHPTCNLRKGSAFLTKCPWPSGTGPPARPAERAARKARSEISHEFGAILVALDLVDHWRFVEEADGWNSLPLVERVEKWRQRLSELGPSTHAGPLITEETGVSVGDGIICSARTLDPFIVDVILDRIDPWCSICRAIDDLVPDYLWPVDPESPQPMVCRSCKDTREEAARRSGCHV